MSKVFSGLRVSVSLALLALTAACGTPPNVGGRATPPDFDSRNYPRAMVAIQNPGVTSSGALQFLDVLHNTASNKENSVHAYSVSGFNGSLPVTIQDFPGLQVAWVYGSGGTGSFTLVSTSTDTTTTSYTAQFPGPASSIYVSPDFNFIYAADPTYNGGLLTVYRRTDGYVTMIPLSNISKLALSPGGGDLLAFQSNTNNVYQLVGINGGNSIYDTVAMVPPPASGFDRPINATFSADGSFMYVMNCGPECGGNTSSVTVLSTTVNAAGVYPVIANIPVPGGATFAIQSGTTLYVSGQSEQGGYFTGNLSTIDLTVGSATQYKVTSSLPIGDGYHFRMSFGDDGTLWIGAKTCAGGLRAQTGQSTGCLTMVKIAANTALVEPAHGDLGGIAPIYQTGPLYTFGHELYSAEGGAVYIYSTVDGSAIDSSLVQVVGYASDIAFVDGLYNTQP